ncbi:thiamine pyrophosphate-binding protein [Halobacterium noricense]|uniref:thiamine pyrophosphate-binding protein n=1 Tax=Halobacterium noricense TaxID=223182 RepID=UPI001E29D68F|nr:thiamine pyrophosphate-binding protein [Halobacterium noricense]UHH23913.1 thiamine pyrophosphate-binding protein [Halobacterium noricense]
MVTDSENPEAKRGGEYIYDALVDAGIELLVGLPGTQTLPLDRVVADRDEMDYIMARHETSIPHLAWGYYEASERPAATLTVPGPGDTNTMHGLKNAYNDCVPLVHISADADPEDRGKAPIHEIEPDTYDNVVKANINVEKQVELTRKVEQAIEAALTEPYGPVRLGVPSGILQATFEATPVTISPETVQYDNTENYAAAARELAAAERPVVYVGGGARRSSNGQDIVMRLAKALDAPVVTSYKGKGVFPEDNPRFAGVTAKHLPQGAVKMLESADVVLALGTDFDGVTTSNWSLPMGDTVVHVNLDVDDINAGYQADIPIIDDVGHAGEEILSRMRIASDRVSGWNGTVIGSDIQDEYISHLEAEGLLDDTDISTPSGLRTVREALPRGGIVTTDIGGFRLWSKQVFSAYDQACYITAGSWAGMGVGLPAALGAKAAHPERPVVSLHGDGGLMMCLTELHTAVESNLSIVLVVFNNSDYGIISKSSKIDEYTDGSQFEWASPDFTAIAEGFGCRGVDVDSQSELRTAVKEGMDADVPTVINVDVPADEQSVVDASTYESKLYFEEL